MIKIVADTLSCISPSEARQLGLEYIPQIIVFGEETFRDDTEMDPISFLKRLRTSAVLPKTAAPPPAMYTPIFKELTEQGHTVIVVTPTAEMSGTYRSASVAAQDFAGADIRVIDTKIIAGGLGAVVKQALKWANAGLEPDVVVEKILEMSSREHVYFVVDTLEFLYRGGRIGAAKALFGSILQMKPILTINQGHTEAAESQRTQKRALARLKEIVLSDCPRDPEAHLCLMHGDAEELARSIAAEFSGLLGVPVDDIPIYDLTPAILTHSGPGVIGISYFTAPEQK
jgi:DegV family protein with EDD domain